MNWSLFWSAFGAIGSTVGSVATAIALIVAIKQYRAPLKKRLKISVSSGFVMPDDTSLFIIEVANTGLRELNIEDIRLSVDGKPLFLQFAQFNQPDLTSVLWFPISLSPEQKISMYIEHNKLSGFLQEEINRGAFDENSEVEVVVYDQTGGSHFHRTHIKACDIASAHT